MWNPWADGLAASRAIEREHGGEAGRGGGLILGCVGGVIAWTLILMFVF